MLKTLLAATTVAAFALPAQAVSVVEWNFESAVAPSASTTWTGIAPSVGTGTASGVHTATTTWATFSGNGSAKAISAANWGSGDYWQFSFSTTGYTGVSLGFDQIGSNTGPRDFSVLYSTNGGSTFVSGGSYTVANVSWSAVTPVTTSSFSFDLSGIAALNNNASVIVRLQNVSNVAINGGTVATAGTGRIDNFVVSASPVPEPGTYALLLAGLGVVGFIAARRRA